VGADGKEISLESPFGDELPAAGFDPGMDTYQAPPEPESRGRVQVRCVLPRVLGALWLPLQLARWLVSVLLCVLAVMVLRSLSCTALL
jgi:hypothetical protein